MGGKSILRFVKARRVSNVHAAHGMDIFWNRPLWDTWHTQSSPVKARFVFKKKLSCPPGLNPRYQDNLTPPPLPRISGEIINTFVFNETVKIELALGNSMERLSQAPQTLNKMGCNHQNNFCRCVYENLISTGSFCADFSVKHTIKLLNRCFKQFLCRKV